MARSKKGMPFKKGDIVHKFTTDDNNNQVVDMSRRYVIQSIGSRMAVVVRVDDKLQPMYNRGETHRCYTQEEHARYVAHGWGRSYPTKWTELFVRAGVNGWDTEENYLCL